MQKLLMLMIWGFIETMKKWKWKAPRKEAQYSREPISTATGILQTWVLMNQNQQHRYKWTGRKNRPR